MRSLKWGATVAIGIAALACSDTPTESRPGPRLTILGGAGQQDSINSTITNALIVEVRDRGELQVGLPIDFEAASPLESTRSGEHVLLLCAAVDSACGPGAGASTVVRTETDGAGRAVIRMYAGTVAEAGRVRISAPSLALADSVAVLVLPGAVTRFEIGARDTTVYVGNSYDLRLEIADRVGNRISPTYTVTGAAVEAAEGRVQGTRIGRSRVVITTGAHSDTVWATVPPRGKLVAYYHIPPAGPWGLALIELDGSGFRPVVSTSGSPYGIYPAWSRDGRLVAFENGDRVFLTDTLGNAVRITPMNSPTSRELHPSFSPDGSIYFAAEGSPEDYGTGIWHTTAAGESPVRIGPNPPNNANAWQASVAPDGTRLVYHSVNAPGPAVMNIGTGAPTYLGYVGQVPRWSPSGDWIVFSGATEWIYLDEPQQLHLIRPTGAEHRTIVPSFQFFGRADWSPDGKWLIARGPTDPDNYYWGQPSLLKLIEVASGDVLPLPWSQVFSQPAWRP